MKKKLISISIVVSLILVIIYISYFSELRTWKTQNIIYRNKFDKEQRIEFQVKKEGRIGYSKRIVFIEENLIWNTVEIVDTNMIDKRKWVRVEEYVNELGL